MTILFLSCYKTIKKNTKETFIIPIDTFYYHKNTASKQPFPPPDQQYYYPLNFIIDTAEHIYVYQRNINSNWCAVSSANKKLPPHYINLQPHELIEIPSDNIELFIHTNLAYFRDSIKLISVASTQDTFISYTFANLLSTFNDIKNHIRWRFRKTTQEENIVLEFKKHKFNYDPLAIKWDSSQILFVPKF